MNASENISDFDTTKTFLSSFANTTLVIAYIIVFVSQFVIGIIGNTLLVYFVLSDKTMQSITNLFVVNLALSDILICMIGTTLSPTDNLVGHWVFGLAMCHIGAYTIHLCVYVSTFTSVAIAIHRFILVVFPFMQRIKKYVCYIIICIIWVISIGCSLPLGIYHTFSFNETTGKAQCDLMWPSPTYGRNYTIVSLFVQFIIPCSIITFCYCKIYSALKTYSSRVKKINFSRQDEKIDTAKKRKTNSMLALMVVLFVGCWLPFNAVILAYEFGFSSFSLSVQNNYGQIFAVSYIIAIGSTMFRPLLFSRMKKGFKIMLTSFLSCKCSKARSLFKRLTQNTKQRSAMV